MPPDEKARPLAGEDARPDGLRSPGPLADCDPFSHDWKDPDYYEWFECRKCGTRWPPWAFSDGIEAAGGE